MDAWVGGLEPFVHLVGLVLLHFVWQGALVGAAFALLRRGLGAGKPRYALGLACFAALTLAPLITAVVLASSESSALLGDASMAQAATIANVSVTPMDSGSVVDWMAFLPWLVALWGAGVVVLTLRAVLHWRDLNRLIREGVPFLAWDRRFSALCDLFGLRKIGLLYSNEIQTPTLVGWLKPVILLPAAVALRFPAEQIELILAHELGHLRRWDHLVNLLQVVVETVLFYHPVVHWISRDLRDQREICCDSLVLEMSQASAHDYVATLADLEQLRLDGPAALALSATGGILLERVQHIAQLPPAKLDLRAPARLVPVLVVGALVLTLGIAQRARWSDADLLALWAPPSVRELLRDERHVVAPALAVSDTLSGRALRLPAIAPIITPGVTPTAAVSVEPMPTPAAVAAEPIAPSAVAAPTSAPLEAVAAPEAPVAMSPDAVLAPAAPAAQLVSRAEPVPVHAVQPAYPERALLMGTSGTVKLSYLLDGNGRVRDVRVEQSSPYTVFDNAATNALRKWRFEPGTFEVGSRRYTRQFVFSLDGRGLSAPVAEESIDSGDCRTITGTRICRRASDLNSTEVDGITAVN